MTKEAISTERALNLALEALELNDAPLNNETVVLWEQKIDKAITALREALTSVPDWASEAIEQSAQQEPVAWRNAALRVGEDLCSVGPFGYYDMTAEQWLDWALSVVTVHASPPQQEPVAFGALAKRRVFDYIRGAYDLGYNDARQARTIPGDGAPGYKGRDVEADHGGALLHALESITSPPTLSLAQRTWVGLTDEEIDVAWNNCEAPYGFAEAIEAKLKEKNSD